MGPARAVLFLASAANAAHAIAEGVSPVRKAAELLANIRVQLLAEAETEAATYNKFACFCKDTLAAKSTAISTSQNTKDTLQGQLNTALLARDAADALIVDKQQAIQTAQQQVSNLTAQRRDALLQYEKNEVDLTGAVQALEAAIQSLYTTKKATSFVELQPPLMGTIIWALSVAESLGSVSPAKAARAVSELSALQRQSPSTSYSFHSDNIISTLEDLRAAFKARKSDLDQQEVSDRQAFESQVQALKSIISQNEVQLESQRQNKDLQFQTIAVTSQDLTTTSAQLLDDQAFLAELSGQCSAKALLWDARTQARADELAALTSALQIMEQLDAQITPAMLLQAKRASRTLSAKPAINVHVGIAAAEEPTAKVAAGPMVRSRRQSIQSGQRAYLGWRAQVISLLRRKGEQAHSGMLLQLARKAADDPFAKVKVLIQGLIERLLKEATQEADHKGWCDREVALAEQTRDLKSESITELNSRLQMSEARRAKLASLLTTLDGELQQINSTLAFSTQTRQRENAENAAAIEAARQNKAAVEKAIDLVTKFYDSAANSASNLTALLQKGVTAKGAQLVGMSAQNLSRAIVVPDAGFDGAYTGVEGGKFSLLGLLEVVQSDFERTIAQTQASEQSSAQAFYELQTSLGASTVEKNVVRADWSAALQEAAASDAESREKLAQDSQTLANTLVELQALKPACFPSQMTPEERKQQRQEEIDALEHALCILDSHGTGITTACL